MTPAPEQFMTSKRGSLGGKDKKNKRKLSKRDEEKGPKTVKPEKPLEDSSNLTASPSIIRHHQADYHTLNVPLSMCNYPR